MDKLALLSTLLGHLTEDVKNPRTFLYRVCSLFVIFMLYLTLTNQSDLMDFAKNFSRSTVVEQVKMERATLFPAKAKEKATMLFLQSNADAVFVTEFSPTFINNYQHVVAWEGRVSIDPAKLTKSVIDKASNAYQEHVLGRDIAVDFGSMGLYGRDFITNGKEYTHAGLSYMYACPIFNLDNAYSGYVGLAWKTSPFEGVKEKAQLEEYLERICSPQARALGRAK